MTMKKLIAVLALSAAMINPAMAVDKETCLVVKGLAEAVMGARQAGVDVSDMMAITTENPKMNKLQQGLIVDAFSFPAYSTKDFREKEVREFGARHYLNCIKSTK